LRVNQLTDTDKQMGREKYMAKYKLTNLQHCIYSVTDTTAN